MRLVTFVREGRARIGVQAAPTGRNCILDLNRELPGLPEEMNGFLAAGAPALAAARRALAEAPEEDYLPEEDVRLLAPVPDPGKIICRGHNYRDHMGRDRTAPPEFPTFFCKTGNAVIGPGAPIVIPPETRQTDFEAELAAVIGRKVRRALEADARNCIAGYTIFNDVSARDFQKRTSQWMIGQSFDTFGPMGPALVTAEEIPDPQELDLALSVNGIRRQCANTRRMIFSVAYLVAYLIAVMTLFPGDVIATGTPSRTRRNRATSYGLRSKKSAN
jgi:acylpyruvate hydrolase